MPIYFRRFNHNIIKKFIYNLQNKKTIIIGSIMLGVIIASTEFLCSGQIYLSAIVTVIQIKSRNILQGFLYLILYSFVYMIPLIIIIILIIKGKKVIDISEKIRLNLSKIKLIYSIIFLIFAIYMIITML